jgi:2-polyprenyl-6-methoxyphenol hydroxylase-like FAD-dependent oxidoreductase
MRHVPVVIVGGGPVGMVLAISLAAFKIRTMLVNTEPSSRWFPKGSTHNARTMEHYRRLGLARALRKLGLPTDHSTDVGFFTTLNGWELGRISMPSEREKTAAVANASPTDQIPEPLFRCNQMYVEAQLLEHIQALDMVDARFGWRCIEIADGQERVTAVIQNTETGQREKIACDYLAGCDGPQSMVRRHLGIAYRGDRPEEQSYGSGATVATHLRAPDLYRILKHKRCWQYRTVNPRVRSNLVTLDGEGEFTINTKLRNPEDNPDPKLVANLILESVGETIDIAILEHRPWTAGHALVADRFGCGRIALAGDAVHVFTPTGGFGMNTGVDDAVNLAWKIAAMVSGWGGPNLLSSYEAERRPIAFRNTGMAKELSRGTGKLSIDDDLLQDTPAGDLSRSSLGKQLEMSREEFASIGIQLGARYDDSPIIVSDGTTPPADSPFIYQPTACPGGRAPHLFLRDHSSLFDHFGSGFCLLHLHGDHNTEVMEDAARARRVPLRTLKVDMPEGRALYECDLALIRPDQHVAWRGCTLPADCRELLARVTGW